VTLAPSRGHDDDEVVSRDRRERERERERESNFVDNQEVTEGR
jgi:hypothetical protein